MKRLDIVYKKLEELSCGRGVDAKFLADSLNLSRANVSGDLNSLCKMGKVRKSSGRPVLFTPVDDKNESGETETTLDKLIKENRSLITAGEQARAAILYPPRGMHTLILGDTGVGKTMFAGIMHKYAIEMQKMAEDSPFITFNCADYSNNPQLLLGQIFGIKKGAYTGADSDKIGLIEKADGGILFLDEVHRLPAEGQEMFFTFMDKGIFRRLGETGTERKADVLIISATTENPDSSLLKTFTRRIPMIIKIPGLNERGIEERFGLITDFFTEESSRLDREIQVSVNSMRAFLSYNCPNNVGQLKTDVQLACARAYADFLSHKKDGIRINSTDLPNYIREGLYKETEHRQIWNKLVGINSKYCVFNKQTNINVFEDENDEENIYEIIDSRMDKLKNQGFSQEELGKIMDRDIEEYFTRYLYGMNGRLNKTSLSNVVDPVIIDTVDKIMKYSEEKLKKIFSQRVYLGMALHIQAASERIHRSKKIINPRLQEIRTEYSREFEVSIGCLNIIEKMLDISMPVDEAGFLTMFFVLDNTTPKSVSDNVGVLVIAHGNSTATSMAEVANKLLASDCASGINMPLDVSPQQILNNIREHIKKEKREAGFIFLVDMGSLTTFGKIIEDEFSIPVRVIPLVSTLHVLEATRKAMIGYGLDDIYNEVLGISNSDEKREPQKIEGLPGKSVIITVCMTGQGSAVAIKNFLQKHLKYDSRLFEIVPVNFVGMEDVNLRIQRISSGRKIICIISSFRVDMNVPQYRLEEVLNLKAIDNIQSLVDMQSVYLKMGDTLSSMIKNTDAEKLFSDVKECVIIIEKRLQIKIEIDILIGVVLHICCMVDKLLSGSPLKEYPDKHAYIGKNTVLYGSIKDSLEPLRIKYGLDISDNEICFIMNLFCVDINQTGMDYAK